MSTRSQRSATTTAAPAASTAWRDAVAAEAQGVVRLDEDMRRHTTLGIGGPADLWYEPADAEALSRALSVVRRARIPYYVVGGGSNLLVGDRGIRGLVVHLGAGFGEVIVTDREDDVLADFPAGVSTAFVRRWARERGLVGPEFLTGIPGTVGGALRMNAGTRMGEMVDVTESVQVALPDGPVDLAASELGLTYRDAVLPTGAIVTRVRLAFRRAEADEAAGLAARAKDELDRRRRTQPKGKSAGSIFKNPAGDAAGRLIEACGLKGRRVGGAQVSELHANFILNDGDATARDVLDLIDVCRQAVQARFGVHLELEVRILGEL